MRINRDERVRALREIPLFAGCPRRETEKVASLCAPLTVRSDRLLAEEGTPGREWIVISDGRARLTLGGLTVGFAGRGDSVGDIALLTGSPHALSATSDTPVSAYVFTPQEFWSLLEFCPTIAGAITAQVSRRLTLSESGRPVPINVGSHSSHTSALSR